MGDATVEHCGQIAGPGPGAQREPLCPCEISKIRVDRLGLRDQNQADIEMHDVIGSRLVQTRPTVDNVKAHAISVAEVGADRDDVMYDRVLDPTKVLQLSDDGGPFPGALSGCRPCL